MTTQLGNADDRNRKLGAIHMLKARLKYNEDSYRALLGNCYGVTTAANLTVVQMDELIKFFNVQLGKTKSPTTKNKPSHDLVDKIRALWISMGKDGIIKDPSETSLQKWIKGRFRVDNINWLSLNEMCRAVEGLKQWRDREIRKRETENEDKK